MVTNMKKKKLALCLFGAIIGFVNALFGAGGGMICVPLLKKIGLEQKNAQATTLCVILPLTVISAGIYLFKGYMNISDAFVYIIPGFVGSIAAVLIFKKIQNSTMKKIFALFMLWAGIRLISK